MRLHPAVPLHSARLRRCLLAGRGSSRLTLDSFPLLVGLCLFTACSFFSEGTVFGGLVEVRIDDTAPDLNNGFPVAVEAVLVYDRAAEVLLREMSATEWFDRRQKLLEGFGPDAVTTLRREWTPGQSQIDALSIRFHKGARQLFLFANFFAAGQHRQSLELGRSWVLRLEAHGFVVEGPGGRQRGGLFRRSRVASLPRPLGAGPDALSGLSRLALGSRDQQPISRNLHRL